MFIVEFCIIYANVPFGLPGYAIFFEILLFKILRILFFVASIAFEFRVGTFFLDFFYDPLMFTSYIDFSLVENPLELLMGACYNV